MLLREKLVFIFIFLQELFLNIKNQRTYYNVPQNMDSAYKQT